MRSAAPAPAPNKIKATKIRNQRKSVHCPLQNKKKMALLSDGVKQRLSIVIGISKTVFHYGFIPTVLYLGQSRSIRYLAMVFNNDLISGFQKGSDPGMPEITLGRFVTKIRLLLFILVILLLLFSACFGEHFYLDSSMYRTKYKIKCLYQSVFYELIDINLLPTPIVLINTQEGITKFLT